MIHRICRWYETQIRTLRQQLHRKHEVKLHEHLASEGELAASLNEGIPRRIHQLWIPPAHMPSIPDEVLSGIEAWKTTHPHFEHCLWTVEDVAQALPAARAERMMEAIRISRFEAMKADIIRLYLLEEFGGIWSDLKVFPRKPWLDQYIHQSLILTEHFPMPDCPDPTNALINNCIGAEPHHPFIRACIEKVHENIDRRLTCSIWNLTGPKVLMDVRDEWRESKVSIPRCSILPWKYVWGEILDLNHGSYSSSHRHWSVREKEESAYLEI